jgi:hypothetical protein
LKDSHGGLLLSFLSQSLPLANNLQPLFPRIFMPSNDEGTNDEIIALHLDVSLAFGNVRFAGAKAS